MKAGDLVLPDFPPGCHDWRKDWPDGFPGVVLEAHETNNTCTVMAGPWIEEVNVEYLVEIV